MQGALAISATFTAEPLREALEFWLDELAIPLPVEFAPYNQLFQQLLDPASTLGRNQGGINVLLIRYEDWDRGETATPPRPDRLERAVAELTTALRAYAFTAPCIACVCAPSPALAASEEYAALHARLTANLVATASDSVRWISSEELSALYPVTAYYDAVGDHSGHLPYTPEYLAALATVLTRKLHSIRRAPIKVIALDCDHTLWGGVCGEVGPHGLDVSGPWAQLQQRLVEQQQAGALLCLCSKNAAADVWRVFEERPEMPLRREHLTGWKIGWDGKAAGLRALASELNLGLDSFLFLDDNPVECAEVRAGCLELHVVQIPGNPDAIPGFLRHLWALDGGPRTAEDARRTVHYRENQDREQFRRQAPTFAEFLDGLELAVEIAPPAADQWERVAQLTQRTNQFNTTTLRRSASEMRAEATSGSRLCRAVTVQDRFGDHGLVGVMVAEIADDALRVESLLLSCRVLGRGVEHRMLASLASEALALGLPTLEVPFVRTERNQPAHAFLQEAVSYAGQVTMRGQESLFQLPAELMAELVFRPEAAAVEASSTTPVASPVVNRGARTEYDRIATALSSPAAVLDAARRRARRDRPELAAGFVKPRTPLEMALANLWREALAVERVGIYDNFFALGGDSLRGTVLVNRLQSRLGGDLSLGLLFDAPTVAKLAAQLDAEYANAAERLTERQAEAEAPSPVARMAPPESVNISALSDAEVEAMLERLLMEDVPMNG